MLRSLCHARTLVYHLGEASYLQFGLELFNPAPAEHRDCLGAIQLKKSQLGSARAKVMFSDFVLHA